jgi:hypothetical protein
MFFKRKKDVDLRELQKKGIIRIPKKEIDVETDRNGFVELSNVSQESNNSSPKSDESSSEGGFFNFFDSSTENKIGSEQKDQREFYRKIEELDNKIYKLEQRIELLERKSGVSSY